MSNTILFVFEGEKAETKIFQALENYFQNASNVIIKAVYGAKYINSGERRDSDLDFSGLLKEQF